MRNFVGGMSFGEKPLKMYLIYAFHCVLSSLVGNYKYFVCYKEKGLKQKQYKAKYSFFVLFDCTLFKKLFLSVLVEGTWSHLNLSKYFSL